MSDLLILGRILPWNVRMFHGFFMFRRWKDPAGAVS